MTKEKLDLANKLNSEIQFIDKCMDMFKDRKQSHLAHFEVRQNYGDNESVRLTRNLNSKLIEVLAEYKSEINTKLEAL